MVTAAAAELQLTVNHDEEVLFHSSTTSLDAFNESVSSSLGEYLDEKEGCLNIQFLRDISMGEFLQHFEEEYDLEIMLLTHGDHVLYNFWAANERPLFEQRKLMKLSHVVANLTGQTELPPDQDTVVLEIVANDKKSDEENELPYVKFRFR
jgi:Ubiquitin fold domain